MSRVMIGLLVAVHLKPMPIVDPSRVVGDGYLPAALLRADEGQTAYRLDVSNDGRPVKCAIERRSGFADLDKRACAIITWRAGFKPTFDRNGVAVKSSYAGKITGQITVITAAPESN